ncbi:peroxidase [bacterium]|nr:MAG: peroxidase [bacterium]
MDINAAVATPALTLNSKEPLDEETPEAQRALANLQGNILKGHGRDFGVYIFFSLPEDPAAAKDLLRDLGQKYITSALRQHQEAKDFREHKIPGGLFGGLSLSATGLKGLRVWDDMPDEEATGPNDAASTFKGGLAATAEGDFADDKSIWDKGYQAGSLDALLLLADDDESFLLEESRGAQEVINRSGKVVVVEFGTVLRNADKEGIEHFGYVDGRSQPLYLKSDFVYEEEKRIGERVGKETGGIKNWDPLEPLERVLFPDPLMREDATCFGSYLVFRKLEQNVFRFKARESDLGDALGFIGPDRERAGALVVGRFEDGTPVTLHKTDGQRPSQDNDFTYAGDHPAPGGAMKCPFQAHIRKTNPRGDTVREFGVSDEAERARRITRRGIPYGKRKENPDAVQDSDDLPTGDVGLLFMCYQASIREQFAFMQKDWCNRTGFLRPGTGIDPVVGQGGGDGTISEWPKDYPGVPNIPLDFRDFVHMKGGEFFYTPSVKFFQ